MHIKNFENLIFNLFFFRLDKCFPDSKAEVYQQTDSSVDFVHAFSVTSGNAKFLASPTTDGSFSKVDPPFLPEPSLIDFINFSKLVRNSF